MAGLHRGARKKCKAGSCTSCRASGAGGIANLTRCAVSPNCQRIESPKRCATCRRMIEPPKPDWMVIPVHNRREVTLACLRALASDGILDWATILIVDDGSTDGTGEAIAGEFPRVVVLRGNGSWWWAGAIRRGMELALARGAARIFWLNDDCQPPAGGLARLRDEVARSTGVRWIEARSPDGWSYGAHRKTLWRIRRCTPEEERLGKIDSFSGNCVCVPREWIERIGLP